VVRYAAYRLAILVPLVVGLSVVLFFYMQLIPGDPVAAMLGPSGSPELVAKLRHQFGLDQPVATQYLHWVQGLLHGDLGITFSSQQPITPLLINRIPATLQLTIGGMFFTLVIGLPLGFIAGMRKDSWLDRIFSTSVLIGMSAPVFWVGTVLILFFTVNFHWFPSEGYVPFFKDPVASLRTMFLPSLALGLTFAPYLARMTRAATIEVQQEQFVAAAQAKGLTRSTILRRYSARNAVLPVIVVLGLQIARVIGGQVIIENLFAWPGVGRLMIDGVIQRDYFMVQAVILFYAVLTMLLLLAAELVHGWLDPRIRLQ
jgi:peptide/nickel transport system permease protein